MQLWDIGALAKAFNVPTSTLRYYEEIGLIRSIARKGLRRQFGPDAPLALSLVALGKAAGFALDDIAAIVAPNTRPDIPRDELRARADALDVQAQQLTALAEMLRHVADCPAPHHLECPTFQKLLRVAPKLRARA